MADKISFMQKMGEFDELYALIESLVLDIRIQLAVTLFLITHWTIRLPTPKKGAGNKSVFITGCDTGIGYRIARLFDTLGMRVFAGCLNPNGEGARSLKESSSQKLHIVPLDVTKDEQVREAVAYVKENLSPEEKGLFALVNNAGIFAYCDFELMSLKMIQEIVDINLMGTIRVTKNFLPLITEAKGRIVTITSLQSRMVYPKVSAYLATEHALEGFMSSLRLELANKGVDVSLMEPGNFISSTDIMQCTRRQMDEMWNNSTCGNQTPESKINLSETSKQKQSSPGKNPSEQEKYCKLLLVDIEHAVLAEEPRYRYVCAPLTDRLVWCILRKMPSTWAVKFFQKYIVQS